MWATRACVRRLLGDVGVGRHEAGAVGQRLAADREHGAVGPLALEVVGLELAREFHARAHLLLDVAGAVLAALGVVAESLLERRAAGCEEVIGILEQAPLLGVTEHQLQVAVEERDAAWEVVDDGLEQPHTLMQGLAGGVARWCGAGGDGARPETATGSEVVDETADGYRADAATQTAQHCCSPNFPAQQT